MYKFAATTLDQKLTSDLQDYSTFLMAAEKSLKQCHNDCLMNRNHMALAEAEKTLVIITRLKDWLENEISRTV